MRRTDPATAADLAVVLENAIPAAVTVEQAARALAEAPADSIVIIAMALPPLSYRPDGVRSKDLRDISPIRAGEVAVDLGRADIVGRRYNELSDGRRRAL